MLARLRLIRRRRKTKLFPWRGGGCAGLATTRFFVMLALKPTIKNPVLGLLLLQNT
jgi:hypothetical protein